MNQDAKKKWLDRAEVFDSLRVVPRVIIFAYLGVALWLTVYFAVMYFRLPPAERTLQLTAYMGGITGVIWGAFPFVMKIYMDNGRDWDADKKIPSSVTATASVSAP